MKKKILIIINEFIPYSLSLGGIIRVLSLSNFLINKDIEVHILTSKNKYYGYFGYDDLVNNIKISYINELENKKTSFVFNIFILFVKNLKRLFPSLSNWSVLFALDQSFFKIKKYKKNSHQIIKENKIENVLISSPPFSLFFISSFLKKKIKNLNIIYDYRDSWVLRFDYKYNFLQKLIYNKIEKKTSINCNHIICATETIKRKIEKNFDNLKTINLITIMNGYHHNNIFKNKQKKILESKKNINIGYFGIIDDNKYSYRDIGVIYNQILKNPNLSKIYNFYFYGPSYIKNKDILNYKNFNFMEPIDHKIALNKMTDMNYLLVVHTEEITASEVLTGKLFDYIYAGKPIIVISRGETEAGKLITKYKLGININLLKTSLGAVLEKLIDSPFKLKRNEKLIKKFSRENQNMKILDILI